MKKKGFSKALVTGLFIIAVLLYSLPFGKDKGSIRPTTHAEATGSASSTEITDSQLCFRNEKLLNEHYDQHGIKMGFSSAEEYEKAAAAVVTSPDALHKLEKEDGDDVYYIVRTNEFVIVSTDGYIRTYFCPEAGLKYYNKQ